MGYVIAGYSLTALTLVAYAARTVTRLRRLRTGR